MPTSSEPTATAQAGVALPPNVDLHARPAAAFVRAAMAFDAEIVVAAGDREANAKSLLSVLALGAKAGSPLVLRADGPDAPVAVEGLVALVAALVE
jgi:phosphotransferase system HPr (HPr) family protein